MKRLLLIATLLAAMLFTACSGSRYKYETVAGDPMKTRIYTLDNEMKVYMTVNKEQPRLQTAIAVRVGGKNDPAETTGLAHYFEHLMFKGTEQFGTSDYAAEKPLLDEIERLFEIYRVTTDEAQRMAIYHQIDSISYEASKIAIPNEYDKLMSAIGASGTNAFTSQDMTVYIEDIPSNQIENWAKIQADRFRNPVIRGFHTELETVYEEKNMSLTQDRRKVSEALYAALYPNHPYGTQTVLGTQEHLKNPSIINIKNYHKTYYVPNNMAIAVSGDFEPDEVIAIIEKYFGAMQPNPDLPTLQFKPEEPIGSPVVKEVWGLEAENVMIGWRLPATADRSNDIAEIAGSIIYNGQAGLIDLNLNQQQLVLSASGYAATQGDYGRFVLSGRPKANQSLEEVRDLLLAQVAKLRSGDFDENLISATVNNLKLDRMRELESNRARALMMTYSFIFGQPWADVVNQIDRISKITKEDIIAWANEYLAPESYAVIFKREGKDPNEQKMSAPKITPIVTNRDNQSDYLVEIQNAQVTPIEPRFVNFQKDMSQFPAQSGINVLYKKNETNATFTLVYIFDTGAENDPAMGLAFDYLKYLGTEEMPAAKIASQMYDIACDFSMNTSSNQSWIEISGLSENMGKAMDIVGKLLMGAKADDAILANLKADRIKNRKNAKLNQQSNFTALQRYMTYGREFINRTTLTGERLNALTSEELLAKIGVLMGCRHEILYYGPQSEREVKKLLAEHHNVPSELQPLEKKFAPQQLIFESKVLMTQYDASQIRYYQYSNRGEKFDVTADPAIDLFNQYFGRGMNSIVFQEMREARGLAYTARAALEIPVYVGGNYTFSAFIATQNDKMQQAIKAFDDIINNMPESDKAFGIAKEALISRLRTQRVIGENVLWKYISVRDLGLNAPREKQIFEKVQTMTLDDVKATQQEWIKGRKYLFGILGDIKDLDQKYLQTLGPVQIVSQEEIFGY